METYISMPPIFGLFGLLIALVIYFIVVSYDEGSEKVKKIADQIHLGAMVFMRREYTCLLYTSPSPRDRYISRMPSSA